MEHLGIKVTSMTEEEYCLIPMGGVLPKFPQRTLGIGGTGGTVHPSTGKLLVFSRCAFLQISPHVNGEGSDKIYDNYMPHISGPLRQS